MNDCHMINICKQWFQNTKCDQNTSDNLIELGKQYKQYDFVYINQSQNFYLLLRFLDVCFFNKDFKYSFLDWNRELIQSQYDNLLEQMLFDLFLCDYQNFIHHASQYFEEDDEALEYITNYMQALQLGDLKQLKRNGQLLEFIMMKEKYSEVRFIFDIILGRYDANLPYLDWKSEVSILLQFGNQQFSKSDLQQLVRDRPCSSNMDEMMKKIFFMKELVPNYIISMFYNVSPSSPSECYIIQEILTHSNTYREGQLVQAQQSKQYLIRKILFNKNMKLNIEQFSQLYLDCLIEAIEFDREKKKYVPLHQIVFNYIIRDINDWQKADCLIKRMFSINYFGQDFTKQTLFLLLQRIEYYQDTYDMFERIYELALISDSIQDLKNNLMARLNQQLSIKEQLFLQGMIDYLLSNKDIKLNTMLYPYQFIFAMKLEYKLDQYDLEIPINLNNDKMKDYAHDFVKNANERLIYKIKSMKSRKQRQQICEALLYIFKFAQAAQHNDEGYRKNLKMIQSCYQYI